jgi:putative ABC transport system permease protein
MNTVWRKVCRDLAHNKVRTLLVVLSITVGVFALGVVFGGYGVISDCLAEENEAWVPIHMTFWGWPFDRAVGEIVLQEPDIADVERLVDSSFRWKLEGETDWRDGDLYAREDYEAQRMGLVNLWEGDWPTDRTLAIERMTARHLNIPVGTTVIVEVGQRERRLPVVGVIRDSFADPPQFGATPQFFATPETVTWLSGDGFNRIDVRMASYNGPEDVRAVIDQLAERIERAGKSINVWGSWLRDPDEHWFQEDVHTVYVILLVLGALSLGLSVFLIVNTMNAIISQQVWQIGVMKVVGATFGRVVRIYLATALICGGLSLLLAVPLSVIGAHLLARWILDIVNISLDTVRVTPLAVGIQIAVGLIVPLLAALAPVIGGARTTAHRAISSYGLGGGFGRGWFDRLIGKIRRLPRPMTLSLRNTFRRKARVLLTLLTLVLGGVMFVMVMSVAASLDNTIEMLLHDFGSDVRVSMERYYRVSRLIDVTESLPGVVKAEVWNRYGVMLKLPGGGERYTGIWGLPPDSEIFNPRIVNGRFLLPGDGRAIVLNHKIATDEGIRVGDEVRFDIQGEETVWTVVGLILNSERDSFVPFEAIAQEFGGVNRGSQVWVVSDKHDAASHQQLIREMHKVYAANNLEVHEYETADESRRDQRGGFDIVIYLLLFMSVLAAIVGSLGMMGTMSINVIERQREIGVMRAAGATSVAITGIFVSEGVLLGLVSWLFAAPLSYPSARLFSDVVGETLQGNAFDFVYSVNGLFLWLATVILLSALASLWPALQATRVSVREALAYE